MATARKILVVDDEPGIIDIVEANLTNDGFAVISAENGREGLDMARAERPELIILDVMMPEMDGWQVLREIEKDPDLSGTPVIMLTAKTSDNDVLTGLEEGAVEYITKPFNPEELARRAKITLMVLNPKMREEHRQKLISKRKKMMQSDA